MEKQGTINCASTDSNCAYLGDIHVRSQLGNIQLIVGCDDYDCASG